MIFNLALPCLLPRRVTRTLLSTPRCAPLVRQGEGRQRPSFQTRPLQAHSLHRPLKPIVEALSPDTYPPLPFPLPMSFDVPARVGNAPTAQSVPETAKFHCHLSG